MQACETIWMVPCIGAYPGEAQRTYCQNISGFVKAGQLFNILGAGGGRVCVSGTGNSAICLKEGLNLIQRSTGLR